MDKRMSHCDHDREHNRNRPLYLCAVQNPEDGRLLLVDAESGRRVSNVAVIAIEQDAQDPDACRINVDLTDQARFRCQAIDAIRQCKHS